MSNYEAQYGRYMVVDAGGQVVMRRFTREAAEDYAEQCDGVKVVDGNAGSHARPERKRVRHGPPDAPLRSGGGRP